MSADKSRTDIWEGISCLDFSKVPKPKPLIENFLMEGTTQLCYGKFGTRKNHDTSSGGLVCFSGKAILGNENGTARGPVSRL